MKLWFSLLITTSIVIQAAPPNVRPQEGLRENVPQVHALKGARVIPRAGEVLENATILLRNGLIESVGQDVPIPSEARVWDLSGLTVYPGFIDAFAPMGKVATPKSNTNSSWNPSIHANFNILEAVTLAEGDFQKRRELGFTAAHLVPTSGVFRGKGSLIQLTSSEDHGLVLKRRASHIVALTTTSNDYPKSLMGCIALIRQTLLDARWHHQYRQVYQKQPHEVRPGENQTLTSLAPLISRQREPAFFVLNDEADFNRAKKIADEFKIRRVIVDKGYGYRLRKPLKNADLVVSLAFPDAPLVSDPDRALDISLERLQHWELAPTNPGVLQDNNVRFALSPHQLGDELGKFWPNLRKAIQHGLKEETALASLTSVPARLLGEEDRLGEIGNGCLANLVVTDGNPFRNKDARIRQVWIDGKPWLDELDHRKTNTLGTWQASWTGAKGPERFKITGTEKKLKLNVEGNETEKATEVDLNLSGRDELTFTLPSKVFGITPDGMVRLSAYLNTKTIVGQGVLPDGQRFSWSAIRGEDPPPASEEPSALAAIETEAFDQYPAGAYPGRFPGLSQRKRRIFIENATVWTCGPQGILLEANVIIEDGRIVALGRDIKPLKNSYTIDGRGKHITPGLVDCHSHTAISRGVNEGSHAVTCEVGVGDVVDPTDISIYRQLAGGLTTANLLHGSANPMGGRNQVIKLRWGKDAEGLKFKGAKPGVKFALGENVKQANWGEKFTNRYPQTRMGVEQLMRDTFLAAREYGERKQRHAEQEEAFPFRTDLRMESVLEILKGERIVHIHSYRQDEILMFVRLAQEFGFTVGTFQHILEGYKVAEHLKEINAGASSFSDWWAYKFEVYDAIPYNGALLHQAGVLTSFNSDDNELATRLNTEAAKAVKYGGVSPEEALKFVTINPATQLRIQHRVGSLEVGKDADFVVWDGPPLSTLSRCQETWIEGVRYFDQESHAERRRWVAVERQRLLEKVLNKKPSKKEEDENKKDEGEVINFADRLRLLSPWGQYQSIDHQDLYHDGQSLHACTGCYCDFR